LPVQNLIRVPDDLDDDHAVFANLVAGAMQSVRQLTIEGKPYITVLGDGPLGLIMVQLMVRLNASVRLIGRYSEKLALCEKWKIKHRHVDDIGRRADQDVVVDCTGSPAGLELAMQLVRPRGTILVKTMLGPESRLSPGIDLTPLVRHELQLVGSFLGPTSEALRALARRELDVVSLIGRRMKLDDGPELLTAATSPGARRVIVAC
jgi:threonine dehydrogenase-like Zn-dependent dehydrogenase